MPSKRKTSQVFRRIVLPSGKTVEVVRGSDPRGDEQRPEPKDAPLDPHRCLSCDSQLVYPIAWEAEGESRWSVELRCPNCQRMTTAVLETEAAERFDEELEHGAETLITDLARLTQANMEEDVERFVAALRADAVLPMDF